MKIHIPNHVKDIIQRLLDHGYPTYLVGGSVRDNLLDVKTDDYDLATAAFPHEVKEVFSNCNFFDYGERHGTIGLSVNNSKVEITTFREEEGYTDGRRPDKVIFVRNLTSDVNRRDFTINALVVDIDGNIIDLVDGLQDFENSIIRAVGDPNKRFEEDSLRVLRAIRFAARLGFTIEDETRHAIIGKQELLITHAVSGERIFAELNGILKFPRSGFTMLADFGILQSLFPSIDHRRHDVNLKEKFNELEKQSDPLTVWAVIFVEWFSNLNTNMASEEIAKIFHEYPGMNKKDQKLIKFLVECGVIDEYFLETNHEDAIKYWFILPLMILDQTAVYEHYFTYAKMLNSIIHKNQISMLRSRFLSKLDKIVHRTRISGEEIISLGFSGKRVGILLKLIPLIQLFKKQDDNIRQILNSFSQLQGKEFANFTAFILHGLVNENLPNRFHQGLRDLIYDIQFLCHDKHLKLILCPDQPLLSVLQKNLINVEPLNHRYQVGAERLSSEVSRAYDPSKINICALSREDRDTNVLHNNPLDLVIII